MDTIARLRRLAGEYLGGDAAAYGRYRALLLESGWRPAEWLVRLAGGGIGRRHHPALYAELGMALRGMDRTSDAARTAAMRALLDIEGQRRAWWRAWADAHRRRDEAAILALRRWARSDRALFIPDPIPPPPRGVT